MRREFIFLALILASVGCAKDNLVKEVDSDLIPIGIHGSINQTATRATAEGFVDGDAVGLFAVNYTDNNTQAGVLVDEGNQADNVKYIFDESNHK